MMNRKTTERPMPNRLVIKAVFKPLNNDGTLLGILLTSNSCSPIKIPKKVPITPIVASNEGPAAIRDFFLVIRRFKINTTKRKISARLNVNVAEVANAEFQSTSTIYP